MTTQNLDNKLILNAKRYARAIFDIAKSKNEIDKEFEDLNTVSEAYNSSQDLKDFLTHPAIALPVKKEAIREIFENKISNDTLNLLFILTEKNKFNLIDAVKYCFETLKDEQNNIVKVKVICAVEIDENITQKLKNKLENKLKKSVRLDFETDPKIIAGMILKIEDKTIDGSLANKLESLQKQLA